MRNLPNTRLFSITLAAFLATLAAMSASPSLAQPPPQIPATFYGSVTVDGDPAPEGTEVRAFIDGKDCTQVESGGTILEEGVARYVIAVVHETQVEGCGTVGAEVVFKVGGVEASPAGTWSGEPLELDLTVGPLPSPSPAASATVSATASAAATRSPVTSPGAPGGGEGNNAVRYGLLAGAGALAIAGLAVLASRKFKGKA